MLTPTRPVTAKPQRWLWSQHWRDLLFAHWQVPADTLRPYLPAGLELDDWEGTTWVSTVAFRLERVGLCGWPWLPSVGFTELNLRTYVRRHGEPGIHFLSIHADSWLGVQLARCFTLLPYARADIACTGTTNRFAFECRQRGERLFGADYQPMGPSESLMDNSLAAWLLERYQAWVADRHGRLRHLVVEHPPWQVQEVVGDVSAPGLGRDWGLELGRQPDLCHFSAGFAARLSPFLPEP